MKTPSDKLFQLIKAMTKNEKRNFSMYANSHLYKGENLYGTLFYEIDKQDEYNENILRIHIDKRVAANLPFYKNYLYNLVLQFLGTSHTRQSVTGDILSDLTKIDLLLQKSLRDQALEVIQKAKEKCRQICAFDLYIHALETEVKIVSNISNIEDSEESIAKIFIERDEVLLLLKNVKDYERLDVDCFVQSSKRGYSAFETKQIFREFSNHVLLKDIRNAKTLKSKAYFHFLNSFICYSENDMEGQFKCFLELDKLFQSSPVYMQANFAAYANVLYNIVYSYIEQGKAKEAYPALKRYKALAEHKYATPRVKKSINILSALLEGKIYILSLDVHKVHDLVLNSRSLFTSYKSPVWLQYTFHLNWVIAYLYFLDMDYKECRKRLTMIFNDFDNPNHELFFIARILDLLLAVEKNELFDYEVLLERKTKQNVRAENYPKTMEILFSLLSSLRNTPENKKEHYKTAHQKFKQIALLKEENSIYHYLPLHVWALAKSRDKHLIDQLKENKKQREV